MTLEELKRFMNTTGGTAAARAQFNAGFAGLADPQGVQPLRQISPVWDFVQTFNITGRVQPNGELWTYDFYPTVETGVTTDTTIVSCGADTNYVEDIFVKDEVPYLADHNELAFMMCREKCANEQSFLNEFYSKEYNTGLGFYSLFSRKFWNGTTSSPSIFNGTGKNEVVYYDFEGTGYSDLNTADASTLASFFMQKIDNNISPVIFLGPVTAELMGWRQQGTGDTCSEVWACMLSMMANRMNVSIDTVRGYFQTNPIFDNVTGIDINAPTNADSVVMVMDRSKLYMGVNSVERTPAFAIKDDQAHTRRQMWTTGLQKRSEKAVVFGFNFIDHALVLDRIGNRYDPNPIPSLTANRIA